MLTNLTSPVLTTLVSVVTPVPLLESTANFRPLVGCAFSRDTPFPGTVFSCTLLEFDLADEFSLDREPVSALKRMFVGA